ncbi:MAG TPA: hypothetical protein VFP15_15030, partial [Gemmatimonadaceae bacterium]|nr:hypothetical protein [Gemmatimonadaceae bacterium]
SDALLFIAALLALDLLIMGSALYAEDVSIKELLLASWAPLEGDDVPGMERNPSVRRYSARYESAQRKAATDHAEIHRLISGLSGFHGSLIPDAAEVVDQLHDHIRSLVSELRILDRQMHVETDRTGSVMQRLDSAVDALHEVRLDLMDLCENGFEHGLDTFTMTRDRAQSLSLGRDGTNGQLSR